MGVDIIRPKTLVPGLIGCQAVKGIIKDDAIVHLVMVARLRERHILEPLFVHVAVELKPEGVVDFNTFEASAPVLLKMGRNRLPKFFQGRALQ
jgi:hypothetical protein